jgi:hypothetical protein
MEKQQFLKIASLYTILLTILLMSACAIKTSPNISLSNPQDKKIPVRAGYYVNPKLCKWKVFSLLSSNAGTFDVGETLCAGVDYVINDCFQETVKLVALDNLESQNINVIIIPDIATPNSISLNRNALGSKGDVVVKLKWSIADSKNNILSVQTITGEATGSCFSMFGCRDLMEKGLQDHFQKALESLLAKDWNLLLK